MIKRRKTRKIYYGNLAVGGDEPISIQSMTNTKTKELEKTVAQIEKLTKAGCEIIRVAVPSLDDAQQLAKIKQKISIPLIADIHFDYKLALEAIGQGVDGLRLNPGNIGSQDKVKKIVKNAKKAHIPIRIGVNAGSLEKKYFKKYGLTAKGMVESALAQIQLLEDNDFKEIVISLKASDILMTLEAYQILAKKVDYPFHIGITEAGTYERGTIKSAIGIGSLLLQGLGDTIRVSLTGEPVTEVKVAWQILEALKIRQKGVELISCPTCGRTEIDLLALSQKVEKAIESLDKKITIAVMGCVVNGPGEAREADIGIAGGKNEAILFKKGKVVKKIKEEEILTTLMAEIEKM